MILKKGVKLTGIRPELLVGIMVVDSAYRFIGEDLVITSVTDSKHSKTSLHYVGFAFDCRTRNLNKDDLAVLLNEIKNGLTDEFDVVLESNHIHIEFQPKR